MAEAAGIPNLAEALAWVGAEVGSVDGAGAGQVQGLFVDSADGGPVWLVVRTGRRRSARVVAVPMRGSAGAPFGAWVAYEERAIRSAPVVDPTRPLRREHELTICSHFGIGEAVGRAAEVAARPEGEITATPPGG
jgi:hypothetical protein